MCFELDRLLPLPMLGREESHSEIWDRQLVLETPGRYEIYAPSGRGKTTFVHILYGLRTDFDGQLLIRGKPSSQLKPREWSELRQQYLSIVFQDLRLFPQLTAWENIRVKHVLHPHASESDLRELCHTLRIDQLLEQPCAQISFGERQRVALVRAMSQPFRWLLLDEPFSHLDQKNTQRVCELIEQQCNLRQAGCLLMKLDTTRYLNNSRLLRL